MILLLSPLAIFLPGGWHAVIAYVRNQQRRLQTSSHTGWPKTGHRVNLLIAGSDGSLLSV